MPDAMTPSMPTFHPSKPWACVVRLGGIGDNLIASSILPLLAETHNVEVICQTPQSCVFEHNPYISKLTAKKLEDFPTGGGLEWQKWFQARGKEYDRFVHLSHTCETVLAFVPAQSQFYWPAKVRREWADRSYLDLVHDLADVPRDYAPGFFPTDEETQRAIETKRNVGPKAIGWVLSGSRLDKIWPQAPVAIARIIQETKTPVMLFGGPGKDYEITEQILDHVRRQNGSIQGLFSCVEPSKEVRGVTGAPGETIKLGGIEKTVWPIRRSLTQIQHCDLVVTPDTGLAWATAMHAMPKIVLLSHASPKNIVTGWKNTVTLHADSRRVPCWPCHQLHDDINTCTPNATNTGAACISDISTDRVVSLVKELLGEHQQRTPVQESPTWLVSVPT